MEGERAKLSSAATALDDLLASVQESTAQVKEAGREDLAADLYEVERSLEAAGRRLATVVRQLR